MNMTLKVLGIVTTVIGTGVTLLSGWVNEQKMNETIEEKVNEALAKRDSEEDEEES